MNSPQKTILENRFIATKQVPNVKGMGLKDALYILESLGLSEEPIGEGTVVYQSIEPGTKVNKGDKIFLKLIE
jgi:cell division protein FtsI (penicillin-binding protein 3)